MVLSFLAAGERMRCRLRAQAATLLGSVENGLDRIMMGWLLVAGLASALRILTSPAGAPGATAGIGTVTPYLLLILAPFASLVLALRGFSGGDSQPQPLSRLARVGRWRSVTPAEAMRHRLYGAGGIMVSLLIGMLLNVPVRAIEYLASMPAIAGPVPSWLWTLHLAMTVDVVLLTSLYTIAFVAALRRVPLFPRLLAAIWLLDISMQLVIAKMVAAAPNLPSSVAAALQALLEGNVAKVMISIVIWLPYLLLSKRVNVTYRHRISG